MGSNSTDTPRERKTGLPAWYRDAVAEVRGVHPAVMMMGSSHLDGPVQARLGSAEAVLGAGLARWYRQLARMDVCAEEGAVGAIRCQVTGRHYPAGCKVRWCTSCCIGLMRAWRDEVILRLACTGWDAVADRGGPLLCRLSFEQTGWEPIAALDAALRCWARCWRKLRHEARGLDRCRWCKRPAPRVRTRHCRVCRRPYHPRATPGGDECKQGHGADPYATGRCNQNHELPCMSGHEWAYCRQQVGEWCEFQACPWIVVVECHKSGWVHMHPVLFTGWMTDHTGGRKTGYAALDRCWRESGEEGVKPGSVWIEPCRTASSGAVRYVTKYVSKGAQFPQDVAEYCTRARRRLRSRWQERGRSWPQRFGPSRWEYVTPADVVKQNPDAEPIEIHQVVAEAAIAARETAAVALSRDAWVGAAFPDYWGDFRTLCAAIDAKKNPRADGGAWVQGRLGVSA